jgi:sugar phosphate isomerase/epimerase
MSHENIAFSHHKTKGEMMKIGSTLVPLVGWWVDPRRPKEERERHLGSIRELIQIHGLEAIELSLDFAMVYPNVMDEGFYLQVARLQEELGFACTVHLPFIWIDIASLNEFIRKASVECIRRGVELVRPIDVASYVLHPWGRITREMEKVIGDEKERLALLRGAIYQSGRSLAEICSFFNPKELCLENVESPSFEIALPLVERHGTSICLDVGHLLWQGGGELSFLEEHKGRVREIHIHDALQLGDEILDHLPLGRGEIDFSALLSKLSEIGFEGCVIIENDTKEDLMESLRKLHTLL